MKINMNSAKFLNRETDLKHKDIVTIVSEGMWVDSRTFKRDDGTPSSQFDISIRLANGEERATNLNGANVKFLGSAFGDESKDWIGKEVRAWKTKSEKAKSGFTYLYVPLDWERDDTGEWIIPEGTLITPLQKPVVKDYPISDIKPEDIPF